MFRNFASHLIEHNHDKESLTLSEILAIFSIFLIFLVSLNGVYPNSTFFGVDKIKGLSFFNQTFWTFVFFISLFSVVISKSTKSTFFVVCFPIILYCCFFFLSALWSLAPSITIRRSTLELFVVLSILFSVLNLPKSENALAIFYKVAQYILILNIFMFIMQNGFDDDGLFHGVHFTKNNSGVAAVFCIFVGCWHYFSTQKKDLFNLLFVILWIILLGFSQSKTSIGLLVLTPLLLFFLRVVNRNISVSMITIFSLIFLIFAFLTILGVDFLKVTSTFVAEVGFTGRDDIWQFLIAQIKQRPLLGFGYGGFWEIGAKSPNIAYGTGFIPSIGQAHNGFVDIILNVGCLGLFFFSLLMIQIFTLVAKLPSTNSKNVLSYCFLFLIFSFLHNFTESSFIRSYTFVWIMMLISIGIIYKEYTNEQFKIM